MKFALVAYHVPEREGTATGRALFAMGEGLVAEGHDVTAWSWSYDPPAGPLPAWCEWRPLPGEPALRTRVRALVRPRSDIVRAGWRPPPDAVAVADEPVSFPAVAASSRAVLTIHYLTALDAPALGRHQLRDVQSHRAERRFARQARAVLAYSERVARAAAVPATFVPIPYAIPDQALPPVDRPVAGLLANWEWPPNHGALAVLLDAWPAVRARVPGARLLLAGRGLEAMGVGAMAGVEQVGAVGRVVDFLARVSVVAFPCPGTSGPKVKVLEALSYGLPVVTTPAGAEGLVVGTGRGVAVAGRSAFGDTLAAVLGDPERRAGLGRSGREDVLASHAPRPAARLRVAAIRAALGSGG